MKSILKSLYQYSKNKDIKELIFNAFGENYWVRQCTAENQYTPISVLEKLSKDEEWMVRFCIAENQNTPIHILEELMNDCCYDVSDIAYMTFKMIKK